MLRELFILRVGNRNKKMGRKVVCLVCGKPGTLRFKDSAKKILVVYHYDKERYKKGKKSDSSHYIGTLNKGTWQIIQNLWYRKYGDNLSAVTDQKWIEFSRIIENMRLNLNKELKLTDREAFMELVYDARKLREYYYMSKHQRQLWDLICPSCSKKWVVETRFYGVRQEDVKFELINA